MTTNIPNPPQFRNAPRAEGGDAQPFTADDFYKLRQFVEDMVRAMKQMDSSITAVSGTSSGYPPQLGHARI